MSIKTKNFIIAHDDHKEMNAMRTALRELEEELLSAKLRPGTYQLTLSQNRSWTPQDTESESGETEQAAKAGFKNATESGLNPQEKEARGKREGKSPNG